ncbi:hypothetical protein PGH26_13655 [Sporosarcina jeotgali]|uniref:Uncharacterized protein n=1 Tax=Sporosarcina jeotgali TaxID=3020056 RepID=A0ABZ0KUH6_9BACL|nr:hypothetical protein [Sporosarcina sp. B2O-1]WOV83910.1 hypothetical protein PGH26_13655 [Sporosarcina sp. B2O-1]
MLHFESKQESLNLYTYELKQLARSRKEAQRLIDRRSSYFASLYDDIIYPSVKIDPLDPGNGNPDTAHQALKIIDMKDAYDARIFKAKAQYETWRGYLQDFSEADAEILIRYFEDGDPIPIQTIDRLLTQAGELHDSYQEANGKAKDFEAYEEYQEQLKATRGQAYRPKGLMVLQGGRLIGQLA